MGKTGEGPENVGLGTLLSPRWGSAFFHNASPGSRPGLHSFAASRLKGYILAPLGG
ncbi:MAG TPA: hypothetical protein VKR26_00085 [Terriglobales bacterium]|nr:hypothetical protein [Terriglobales bacterium]